MIRNTPRNSHFEGAVRRSARKTSHGNATTAKGMCAVRAKGAISQKTGPRVRRCFAKTYVTRRRCDDFVMEHHHCTILYVHHWDNHCESVAVILALTCGPSVSTFVSQSPNINPATVSTDLHTVYSLEKGNILVVEESWRKTAPTIPGSTLHFRSAQHLELPPLKLLSD